MSTTPLCSPQEVAQYLKPIIIGGDILAYSYVREFHRAYGIETCIVLANHDIKMLSSSRFTDYRQGINIHDGETLYATLERIASELKAQDPKNIPLILGCDDVHARFISQGKGRLQAAGIVVPYIDFSLLDSITQKHVFYDLCEELDIPYPKTWYFSCGEDGPEELPVDTFPYPLIAKPSNSAQFQEATIEGWRKIYEIESPEELARVWHSIRVSDYNNELVLQDFIPGEDDSIRTLTTFSDANGEVKVVSGGMVCLQDHDPTALGNPVCIMGDKETAIIENAKKMLAHIKYRGFANFDIKYDERDGSYRFFEVNTRCGRNTYYMSLGGVNFTTLLVREFITGEAIPYTEAYNPFVFCVVPKYVLTRSIKNESILQRCLATLKTTDNPYVLSYKPDTLEHKMWSEIMFVNQIRKFKRFYWDTDGKQLKE